MEEISLFVSNCWPSSRIRISYFWEAGRDTLSEEERNSENGDNHSKRM